MNVLEQAQKIVEAKWGKGVNWKLVVILTLVGIFVGFIFWCGYKLLLALRPRSRKELGRFYLPRI